MMKNSERFINKLNLVGIRRNNMVQALVEIDDNTNRVLNIVKAKFGLKDKGKAIEMVVSGYIDSKNEPELRPEFMERLEKIRKQKGISFKSVSELRKHIENA